MPRYDFLIIGAGLYGATFANIATRRGKKCFVIDKRDTIGGNCYTTQNLGIHIHQYGPHIFHTSNEKVWNYITQFGAFNDFVNQPLANYKGTIYNLPFNMNMMTRIFDVVTPLQAHEAIENDKGKYKNIEPTNLEEQAIKMVGKTIYEMFIRHYTEKQWGKRCTDLPAETIKRIPLRYLYDNNYFNDVYQGIPKDGYTNLIQKMLEGIEVRLNTDLDDIDLDLKSNYFCDDVIYTGMIDKFFNYTFGKLEYRSLRFIHSIANTTNAQGCAVINDTYKENPHTRSIEHRHFDKDCTSTKTIVSFEYPIEYKEGQSDPYYPIGNKENLELYNKYRQLANELPNVHFAGRLGEYKYYDMDDTIEKAMELAERLAV